MVEFERGEDGTLHQKGRSCMLCAKLKDNSNNDGYNCKYFSECNEENNYPKFKATYKPIKKKIENLTEKD